MDAKTILRKISLMKKNLRPLKKTIVFLLCLLFLPGLLTVRFADAYWTANVQEADFSVADETKKDNSTENDNEGENMRADAADMPIVSSEMVKIVQDNRENLFPINLVMEDFSDQVDALLSHVGEDGIMRFVTEFGQQDIDMFVNTDLIHDHLGKFNFDGEYPENFEISADVTVRDAYPRKQGGCYVGFTDNGMTNDRNTDEFLFVFDGNFGMFYNKKAGMDAGDVLFDSPLSKKTARITVSHLSRHTFVFIDGICVGQYHDGKSGPLRISYGVVTFAEGKTACCSFDNLSVRKVGN